MLRRSIKLLFSPLLFASYTLIFLYPLFWLLAIPLGYVLKANPWYFFVQHFSYKEYIDHGERHTNLVVRKGEFIKQPQWYSCSFDSPPYLPTGRIYKRLWNWYWSEPKPIEKPTTF